MKNKSKYLFQYNHWKIEPINDLELFFLNVSIIIPVNSKLVLSGKMREGIKRDVIIKNAITNEIHCDLPDEFIKNVSLNIDSNVLSELIDCSAIEPAPEIAQHMCFYNRKSLLEWYDVPSDDIYLATDIEEKLVNDFAKKCNVKYIYEKGDKNQ